MKYAILANKGFIELTGSDRIKFLNGLITNKIATNQLSYCLMLSPQGRYFSDFFIYEHQDCLLLEMPVSAIERTLDAFSRYQLRSQIKFCDASCNYTSIYSTEPIGKLAFGDPRHPQLKYKNAISSDAKDLLLNIAKDSNLYLRDKYNLSIPDGDIDLQLDKSFAQEYGIDLLNGISYTKGCYVGQEVVSRVKYQGVVRKKLYSVKFADQLNGQLKEQLISGQKILYGHQAQEIGHITSCWETSAIALIYNHYLSQQDQQSFQGTIANNHAQLTLASFYSNE